MALKETARRLAARWVLMAVLGVPGVLAGCASVNVARDPAASPPVAGESVVTLSVTGNTAQVTATDVITVRQTNVPPGSNVRVLHLLKQVAPGLSRDTSLFVGVLPAGEYEFSTFQNQQTNRFLSFTDGMRQLIGGFAVKEGKPVDLDRLVLTPLNTSVMVGRSAMAASTNVAMLRRFAPEQARFFDSEPQPGWLAPRSADDKVEAYALARPVGADDLVELPDGRIAAGSRLGSVLLRSQDGRWSVLRSGVLESMLSVLPVQRPDATLIAVGELSTMMRLPPGGDSLLPIDAGNLPHGTLLFVDGNDQHGWYVAQQRDKEVTLYRSDKLEGGDWKPLRSESVAFNAWSGANQAWFWRRPGGLAYAVSAGTLQFLDYASGRWTAGKAPNDSRLLGVAPNPSGSLGILTSPGGGFGGVFASLYLSKDAAATWQEIKSDFKVKVSPPLQTMGGTLLLPGGVFSEPELHASSDGGSSWSRRGEFRLDRRLVPLPSGRLLAVDMGLNGLFAIRHSSDEGATWRVEYTNFDQAAYDAKVKK
jgi:hypothetical protein